MQNDQLLYNLAYYEEPTFSIRTLIAHKDQSFIWFFLYFCIFVLDRPLNTYIVNDELCVCGFRKNNNNNKSINRGKLLKNIYVQNKMVSVVATLFWRVWEVSS